MKRFTAQYVYTLAGEPLSHAFVEVEEDGTVVRTGLCPQDETVDEGILCPGFVNAHCHVELSHLKGKFRKGTGMAGFIDQINALRDSSTPEDKLRALTRAMDGLWAQGVQAMADISNCADSFQVKAAHPMYTRSFLEVFGANSAECDSVMAYVRGLQEQAHALGLDAAPTPHSCYTMSPELVTASSAAGLEDGFLSFHSEESDEEEQMMMFGSGPMWDNRIANGIPTPPVTGTSSCSACAPPACPCPSRGTCCWCTSVALPREGRHRPEKCWPSRSWRFAPCPTSSSTIPCRLSP